MSGQTLDDFLAPYEIQKEIGAGGFSRVYLAARRSDGAPLAVKVMNKADQASDAMSELHIQSQFESPYIVNIYDYFEDAEKIVLLMEYINGGELFDSIVKRGSYSEADAAQIVQEILLGLKILHDGGVIHRDLKPENILINVDPDGSSHVKISDFGLAGIIQQNATLNTYCGTEGYAAPEIIQNIPYDKSIDIWSLGVIVYIILSGCKPFDSDNPEELVQLVINGQYEFFSPEFDSISNEAKDLISRMLQVDPSQRITVDDALQHPWIAGNAPAVSIDIKTHLRKFNLQRKMKRVMAATKAAIQFKHLFSA